MVAGWLILLVGLAGLAYSLLGQSLLPGFASAAVIAFLLLAVAGARAVRQLASREVIALPVLLAFAAGLGLADGLLCLWFLVSAGLGHSASAHELAKVKCLLSFALMVVVPTAALLLRRRYQCARPERFQVGAGAPLLWATPRSWVARTALVAALVALTLPVPFYGGWPPLLLAVRLNSPTVAGWLIDLGADVDGCDRQGWTPLTAAVEQGSEAMVRLLLERGAEVDCGADAVSPLVTAVSRGHVDLVGLLLERGADPNQSSVFGPPLIIAARSGNSAIARLLIAGGADLESRDAAGHTCLMVALGYPELIALFIAKGEDANALSGVGNVFIPGDRVTALMVAARLGYQPAVEALLAAGADPAVRSARGMTAGDFAEQGGHHEILELLALSASTR